MKRSSRKLASHASDSRSLKGRIVDMENRLMLERAQLVAHTRAFGGNLRRRLTSPTSLVFAGSMGFIAAEILGARRAKGGKKGRGKSKLLAAGKSAGKSVLGSLAKPLLSMVQLASLAFVTKQAQDDEPGAEWAPPESSSPASPPTLH